MGVPKFFRYISERYPCLSELAREHCIPEFDNLYLDMNGIIHTCSHPDDSNINFSLSEEDMFADIFSYINKLFFLIKPQKLFFMAVDGVAPRAKMNQQRSRRFRSAKEAELLEEKAKKSGVVRDHDRFDSNCITPGTEFMDRLHKALKYFIKSKISTDPLWQDCRIILSGHDFPGEGEHKIMDYIRYLKAQKDYNPNTRHCLYGLDADLIILGLCTHELHFVVLREEVKFTRKSKQTSVEQTRFFLLHLGLLREYIELEFTELKKYPSFDMAKLIDDWILMGFLVGNDFIPHLPCMHIATNALPLLYKTYIKIYPDMKGNINEQGILNLARLEQYFVALSDVEFELFQENYSELKYFEAKQTKNGIDEAFDIDVDEILNANLDTELAELIEKSNAFLGEDDTDSLDVDGEAQNIAKEFELYKTNYYMSKLNENDTTSKKKRERAVGYVKALQWVLYYYYYGVKSWEWYYPHHYAPFISDLRNFKDTQLLFNLGTPFKPFEQLLAVLPAASKQLLPNAYQELMTSSTSELIDFYPDDFKTDLNGKKHEWEAIVLIPFIDEVKLLHAMKGCEIALTKDEISRNTHGPMMQYDYCQESQGRLEGIGSLSRIPEVFCTEKLLWPSDIAIPSESTVFVEHPKASRDMFFPGFPTMKHLKFGHVLRCARVKVFDQPSRNENLILMPHNRPDFDNILRVAEKYLNQIVYVGWPHLIKAKVVAVFNKQQIIDTDSIKDLEPRIYDLRVQATMEHLKTRMGIEFDDVSVMVHVRIFTGTTVGISTSGRISSSDTWINDVVSYPAQGVVSEIAVFNNKQNIPKRIEQLFPTDSTIFFVGNPYYGSEGVVVDPLHVYTCGRLKVGITVLPEPDLSEARNMHLNLSSNYISAYQAAAMVGMSANCLSRIASSVMVTPGDRQDKVPDFVTKVNIGLQFKFHNKNQVRVGYARRTNTHYTYSQKAIELIQAYNERYPNVFDYLSKMHDRQDNCFESDIGLGDGTTLEEINAWLISQDHWKAEKISCDSETVEKETVECILTAVDKLKSLPVKTVKLQVKPHLVLKPNIKLSDALKPKRPISIFDRVVVIKTNFVVPLGYKGTVIGIYATNDPNPVRLECVKSVDYMIDVLFDKPLSGGGNSIHGIAVDRVYRVPEIILLLISSNNSAEHKSGLNPNAVMGANSNQGRSFPSANNNSLNRKDPNMNATSTSNAASEPQRVVKGGSDFWLPTADTKTKHVKNPMPVRSPAHIPAVNAMPKPNVKNPAIIDKTHRQFNNQPMHPPTNDCVNETQILKNILGLRHDYIKNSATVGVQESQQLPQPPSGWKHDLHFAQQKHPYENLVHMKPMPYPPPPAVTYNMTRMPMPLNTFVPPPPMPLAYAPPPTHYVPPLLPVDPHPQVMGEMHNFNPKSLRQKGAFIPLQAMIAQKHPSKNATDCSAQDVQPLQKDLNNMRLDGPSTSTNAMQQRESTASAANALTRSAASPVEMVNPSANASVNINAKSQKKKKRVPRIGCNFNKAP